MVAYKELTSRTCYLEKLGSDQPVTELRTLYVSEEIVPSDQVVKTSNDIQVLMMFRSPKNPFAVGGNSRNRDS